MRKTIKTFLITLIITLSFNSNANSNDKDKSFQKCLTELKPFVIYYELKSGFINVNSEHKLQLSNNTWRYRSYADGGFLGKASEESTFTNNDGFKLTEYNSYRRIAFNKKRRKVTINWDSGFYKTSKGLNEKFNKKIILFDKASQQLAIQCKIKNGVENFTLNLATRSGISNYSYSVVSKNENIKTSMGTLKSIKVKQNRNDSRDVIFWLSPEMDYIPIRFIYKEEGDDSIAATIKNFKYL